MKFKDIIQQTYILAYISQQLEMHTSNFCMNSLSYLYTVILTPEVFSESLKLTELGANQSEACILLCAEMAKNSDRQNLTNLAKKTKACS